VSNLDDLNTPGCDGGVPEGVTHTHVGRCYEAGVRAGLAAAELPDPEKLADPLDYAHGYRDGVNATIRAFERIMAAEQAKDPTP
jgi:hypothetical protein